MERRRTPDFHLIRVPQREEKNKLEAMFGELIAENFPELVKDRDRNGECFGERKENAGEISEIQLIKMAN